MGYTPPQLEVRKLAGFWNIYPPESDSTYDVYMYPNADSIYPYLRLDGGGDAYIGTNWGAFILDRRGTQEGAFQSSATQFEMLTYDDRNIKLTPAGTGKVKFGAYTNTPATDSTGFITILDAAGNTRKLMVQA